MKRTVLAVLLLAAFAAAPVAAGQRRVRPPVATFLASPPHLEVTTQLGTGTTTHAYLLCVDDGGGAAPFGGMCYGGSHEHPLQPQWYVYRFTAEGLAPHPFEVVPVGGLDEPHITFQSSPQGVYRVQWRNGLEGAELRAAGATVHRGALVYPPPMQP